MSSVLIQSLSFDFSVVKLLIFCFVTLFCLVSCHMMLPGRLSSVTLLNVLKYCNFIDFLFQSSQAAQCFALGSRNNYLPINL